MLSGASEYLGRLRRVHALLLTCACAVLLLLSISPPSRNWATLDWSTPDSTQNETELDAALQQAAESALRQREGTIIIMDAQTGRVRASVNLEGAYTQAMMPGSTMKPFTALAALRAGLIEEGSRTVCPGRFTGLSFSLACVHADHLPPFTPSQSIAHSCNYYYATLGQRLGRDRLNQTLRPFGFGQPTGLNEDEAPGVNRPCEIGNRARIRSDESGLASQATDCTAREALGESDHIQVTPIQLLTAYAALLNGGHLLKPKIAGAQNFQPVQRAQINISAEERRIIGAGMAGALRYGTARKARLDSLPLHVLGKTGTALPAKGFRNNGWFVGLAGPSQVDGEADPADIKLAVLVFLPRAHGADAAALSRPIFDAYAQAITRGDVPNSSKRPTRGATPTEIGQTPNLVRVRQVTAGVTHELAMEDYVLGVMQTEGSTETQPEALKALAIAIRTYAVKNRGRHAKDGYDFCSTTHCQRFGVRSAIVREGSSGDQALPYGRPSDTMIEAVRATEGQVLLDDHDQTVDSFFGASCGGETANIASLWGQSPLSHLRGVRDGFCVSGPHAHWTDNIKNEDLLRALQSDARTDIGARLDRLTVTKRDESGRAEFISLDGEQHKTVRGWDFKIIVGRVLGWNLLKSSRFEVSRAGSNFLFRGTGFGHGLGLCQEGAHVMAARGASSQRILEKYFPGTRVGRDAETRRRGDTESLDSGRQWKADLLGGHVTTSPRSGEMFIDRTLNKDSKLRRSEMFLTEHLDTDPHLAPNELTGSLGSPSYEHRVPREPKAPQKFLSISSEHFRVIYPAEVSRRDADQVLSVLDSARADFLRRATSASVSIGGIPSLEVRLNSSTGDFTSRTGQPWWAAAATNGTRIELQPYAILKRRGVVAKTLRHELAHVVINVVGRDRAPRWLEEGFAIYLAGEGRHFSHVKRGLLSTDELERRLERPHTQAEMRALYAQAYLTVSEMVRNSGEASVWRKVAGS